MHWRASALKRLPLPISWFARLNTHSTPTNGWRVFEYHIITSDRARCRITLYGPSASETSSRVRLPIRFRYLVTKITHRYAEKVCLLTARSVNNFRNRDLLLSSHTLIKQCSVSNGQLACCSKRIFFIIRPSLSSSLQSASADCFTTCQADVTL